MSNEFRQSQAYWHSVLSAHPAMQVLSGIGQLLLTLMWLYGIYLATGHGLAAALVSFLVPQVGVIVTCLHYLRVL